MFVEDILKGRVPGSRKRVGTAAGVRLPVRTRCVSTVPVLKRLGTSCRGGRRWSLNAHDLEEPMGPDQESQGVQVYVLKDLRYPTSRLTSPPKIGSRDRPSFV